MKRYEFTDVKRGNYICKSLVNWRFNYWYLLVSTGCNCVTIRNNNYIIIFYVTSLPDSQPPLLATPKRSHTTAIAPSRRDAPRCLVCPPSPCVARPLSPRSSVPRWSRPAPVLLPRRPLPPCSPSPASLASRPSLFRTAPACCTLDYELIKL